MSIVDKLATMKSVLAIVAKVVDVLVHCVEYVVKVVEK